MYFCDVKAEFSAASLIIIKEV